MAAAVTGLALTVVVPSNAVTGHRPDTSTHAVASAVTVPADANVDFTRTSLGSSFNLDTKLTEVMSASDGPARIAAAKGVLSSPLDKLDMTSPYGVRVSPITGQPGELHTGQDYGVACGTDVAAAAAGTVTYASWNVNGYGNRVVIDHGNGLETTYNHLSSVGVTVGQKVERGAVIAKSGTTGSSTGCHLHFEVQLDGKMIDPLGWL